MICKRIFAQNFRNIENCQVCFEKGVNILSGDNAQGKTSLLEAIYFVSIGRSFRGAHEGDLIRFGEDFAKISLDYADSLRNQNISVLMHKDKRRQVEKNKVKITKMSDVIGEFKAVMFCPEHLLLVKSGPAERRAFLDVAISQLRPVYLKSLQKYSKILKQRNSLIKNAYVDRKTFDSTIEFWSMQLAKEAAIISKFRLWYTELAKGYISEFFSEMTKGKENCTAEYIGSSKQEKDDYADEKLTERRYFELLMSSLDREIAAGSTLYGVHKDDVDIMLNGKSARFYASQGQQRSVAVSMKLSEGEICKNDCGEYPIFLLDDVLSELDGSRREFLQSEMKEKQVIMTTCEKQSVVKSDDVKVIEVKNGEFFG